MARLQQAKETHSSLGRGQRLLASNYRIAVGVLVCAMVVITWRDVRYGGLYKLLEPATLMGPLLAMMTELYFYISAMRKQRRDVAAANYDARLGAGLIGSACALMLLAPSVPILLPTRLQIVYVQPLYWILFGYLAASHLLFACFYRGDEEHGPA